MARARLIPMPNLLELTIADGVALIRMRDAIGLNALTSEMADALRAAAHDVAGEERARVCVFAGLPDVFCSGADRVTLERLARREIEPAELTLPRDILAIPVPTIAAMEGHAIGGGLAIGLCADLVLIARESRYGCTFMNMGFTPGMGTTRLLAHVLSPAVAHEMLYTGQAFLGRELEQRSGFTYVLPKAEVVGKAMELAARVAEKPRDALVALKQELADPRRRAYEAALEAESAMHRRSFAHPDIERWIRGQP